MTVEKKFNIYTKGEESFEIVANFEINELGFSRKNHGNDSVVIINATPEAAAPFVEYAEKNSIKIVQMF